MNLRLRIALIIGVFLYLFILLKLLKKNQLNLKYTLLWLFMGVILFFLALFPDVLLYLTKSVGIIEATNGLFAIMIFCILIILISITSIVSKLKENNKKLVQTISLLEKKIREIECSNGGK